MNTTSLILSLVGVGSFAYTIQWYMLELNIPTEVSRSWSGYAGPWKYLTFLNLWLQCIYFTISLLNSLIGTEGRTRASSGYLQKLRDYLFASLAFPIGVFVALMFWSLYFIDRRLIFPAKYDAYISEGMNHMLHTIVLPLQLIELVAVFHVYPRRRIGMALTSLGCAAYLTWVCIIAWQGGFWVYPVFKVLPPVQRFTFMFGCSVGGGVLYIMGESLNNLIWKGAKVQKRS